MPRSSPRPRQLNSSPLEVVLTELPAVVARLVAEGGLQEIIAGRDHADLLRGWVRKAKLGLVAQQAAAEAWMRLERRLGEILSERLSPGRPKTVPQADHFRLRDIGMTKNQSVRAQAIAAIPMKRMEIYFRTA